MVPLNSICYLFAGELLGDKPKLQVWISKRAIKEADAVVKSSLLKYVMSRLMCQFLVAVQWKFEALTCLTVWFKVAESDLESEVREGEDKGEDAEFWAQGAFAWEWATTWMSLWRY